MKHLFLILFIFLNSCSKDYVEVSNGTKPFKGEKEELTYAENTSFKIKEVKTFYLESNFYLISNSKETFLFNVCRTDCNEKLEKFELETNNFAFLIKNSSRFKSENRLILVSVENSLPKTILDETTEKYKTFRFEKNSFIYTLENGTEKTITLN